MRRISYECRTCDAPVFLIDYATRLSCGHGSENVREIDEDYYRAEVMAG